MTPPQFAAVCCYCGLALDVRKSGVSQLVTGWRMNRDAGGANQVIMPTIVQPPTYCCRECIDLKRRGIGTEQTTMMFDGVGENKSTGRVGGEKEWG